MRFLTSGESHGKRLTVIVEGFPSGLKIDKQKIDFFLNRRQLGYGRGARMKIESDEVEIISGVRYGFSTGAPITLDIKNKDFNNWQYIMSHDINDFTNKRQLINPRPGHADLSGGIKYNHQDLRNVLERSSARETAARVAATSLAVILLEELGIESIAFVRSIADIENNLEFSWSDKKRILNSDFAVWDDVIENKMKDRIDMAKLEKDTLGGVIETRFRNLPIGLGSYVHWDRRLDSKIAAIAMSIQAIKGVEIGEAFANSKLNGSLVHDEIFYDDKDKYHRKTNRAGGLEGGMTNGEDLIIRAFMKPISTLMKPLSTVNILNHEKARAATERSDTTAIVAASVILQCSVAWVIVEAILEKFGSDKMSDIKERFILEKEYQDNF